VLKTGRKLTLEPMRPAERRIIHIELRDHPAVTTESAGEEPYRKVTIIPGVAGKHACRSPVGALEEGGNTANRRCFA